MESVKLQIILSLVDEATKGLADFANKAKSLSDGMKKTGQSLTTHVSLPIAGVAGASIKMASDFQSSMEQLVTQAGLPANQLQNLTNQVLNFANSGAQQAPEVLAQGMYHIISLGVPAANAMNVLKLASEESAMSGANLEDVSNALGAAIASNIKGSGNYQNAMAVLNATVGAGNMRMGDLALALGNVLPQATTAGLSLKDVGAALATMTDNGMPAVDAATRLHMGIALMAAPTKAAAKALRSVGISQLELANDMRNKGLLAALEDLHNHLVNAGLTANQQAQVLANAFGGGRTAGSIELLLNNLDRVKDKYALINQGVGKFGQDVADQAQTAAAKFNEFKAQLSDAAIQVGNVLLPIVETWLPKLANWITRIAQDFAHLSPGMQTAVIAFLGILAVLGPLLTIASNAITVFTSLSTAIKTIKTVLAGVNLATLGTVGIFILVGIAVAALAYLIITHWTQIKTFTIEVWTKVKTWLESIWNSIKQVATTVWNAIKNFFSTVFKDIYDVLVGAINLLVGAIVTFFDWVDPNWKKQWQAISDFFKKIWDDITAFFTDIWNKVKQILKTAIEAFKNIIQPFLDVIGQAWNVAWNAISTFFLGIWDGIKGGLKSAVDYVTGLLHSLESTVSGIVGKVTAPIKAVGNTVQGILSSMKGEWNKITGVGASITGLKAMAAGGIVTSPTIALVGEAGPEAVIPLSAFNQGNTLGRGGIGGSGGNIIININGGTYMNQNSARLIANQIARLVNQQVKLRTF